MRRSAGILMPISSLPSPYGIGTMGQAARDFIDFLAQTKQTYWQILPIGPTGYGNSPYSSFSSYAGNPYFIDLDLLEQKGYLKKEEFVSIPWATDPETVDYGTLYTYRQGVLRKAVKRMLEKENDAFQAFTEKEAYWLTDYALYMTIKTLQGQTSIEQWPKPYRLREQAALDAIRQDHAEDILFWQGVQYLFYQQWQDLKQYAHDHGIQIIGDLPIYAARDSVDVWADPDQFLLDDNGIPKQVAGVPPDGFSADGQRWGNPIYNWEFMKETNYQWWIDRIRQQLRFYDVLRIDHFRGFESYYAIEAGQTDARSGTWYKGPGIDLFHAIDKQLGHPDIIAEDLGYLTEDVKQMLEQTGYPGMRVLLFGFDPRDTGSGYLPHCYIRNSIAYAGTHDNETIMGWMESAPQEYRDHAIEYLHLSEQEGYHWGMIRAVYMSVSDVAIIQFADLLGLDNKARINTPSTVGQNWVWRYKQKTYDQKLVDKLARWMHLYGRASDS